MTDDNKRCGFVALVGRPNVGKSTLVNNAIGQKVSIVTPKPQTTRHRILGVKHYRESQILFVDTPGLRAGRQNLMGQTMNRNAEQSIADADVVLFMCDTSGIRKADLHALERIKRHNVTAVAVLNKVDLVKAKDTLLPVLAELSKLHDFASIVPLSARKGDNVDALLDVICQHLPHSPWLYPADQLSDRDEKFRAGELVREKLMMVLGDEVPYGLSVEIERFLSSESGVEIDAIIWVERESQKPIVVGKNGERLKGVGRAARLELKAQRKEPVHLNLWVKVKKNWSDNEKSLASLGYEVPK